MFQSVVLLNSIMKLEEHTEEDLMVLLFKFLKALNISSTAAMTIATYLGMDKDNLISMLRSMVARYEKVGKLTEEDLFKMVIMLTCEK